MAQAKRTLHRLFYGSRQTPAAAADLDFVVQQIIGAAIRRNRTVGITGLLLTIQRNFVQALEGNVDAVRHLAWAAALELDPPTLLKLLMKVARTPSPGITPTSDDPDEGNPDGIS